MLSIENSKIYQYKTRCVCTCALYTSVYMSSTENSKIYQYLYRITSVYMSKSTNIKAGVYVHVHCVHVEY